MLVVPKFPTKLEKSFLNQFRDTTPPWGPIGYVTYKRTYARRINEKRTEEWWETIKRCVEGSVEIGTRLSKDEMERLFYLTFYMKGQFAGRGLWQLGTDTVRRFGLDSLQNCWLVPGNDPVKPFCFMFNELMLGGGVAMNITPELVYEMPVVAHKPKIIRKDSNDVDFIVPDNREGWVELLQRVLEAFFFTGKDLVYSAACVRSKGALIKGFGGIASGPDDLCVGINNIVKVLSARHRKKMRPVDAMDIANIIGAIVVSGNVRRTAQLMLGAHKDIPFLTAKNWELGNIPNWRAMSNNSVSCNDTSKLPEEFWSGYEGTGEPYGLINLDAAKQYGRIQDGIDYRPDYGVIGTNPCQPGWATVLTPEGIRTFDDIDVGSFIWSGQQWTRVVKKVATGIKPVKAFKTRAGVFYGTDEHRVLQLGVKTEVKDADAIDTSQGPVPNPFEIDQQDVMDGLVFGDGMVHKASNNLPPVLCVGEHDGDYFAEAALAPLFIERWSGNTTAWRVKTTLTREEVGRTFERVIPERFVYGDTSRVCGFLRGLYSANGSVVNNRITLKATSLAVVEAVQIMLSSVGIRSYYTTNRPAETVFANGTYFCRESFDLNISTDRKQFKEKIGFLQHYKTQKINTDIVSNRIKQTYDIVDVAELGEMPVYDITVDAPEHTYWSGGLLVSNCGEITLEPYECCNLSTVYLPNLEDQAEFLETSALLYKVQKSISCLPAIYKETQEVVSRNHRLGQCIAGFMQRPEWHEPKRFEEVYRALEALDIEYSRELGVQPSIKLTSEKPDGTTALLAGVSPGVHPTYAEYYVRRIRFAANDPLVELCRSKGYHIEPVVRFDGTFDHGTMVISFPVKAPKNAILAKDISAIKQLDAAKWLQRHWADNSVSVTVYYKKEELQDIKAWLAENWKEMKTASFLLHSEHGFKQAPMEEITKQQYEELSKVQPITSLDDKGEFEMESVECAGGFCPIK